MSKCFLTTCTQNIVFSKLIKSCVLFYSAVAYTVALGLFLAVGREATGKIPKGKVCYTLLTVMKYKSVFMHVKPFHISVCWLGFLWLTYQSSTVLNVQIFF